MIHQRGLSDPAVAEDYDLEKRSSTGRHGEGANQLREAPDLERERERAVNEIGDLLDKIWDDVMAGPHPERGLEKLRKIPTPLNIKDEGEGSTIQRSLSMPASPATPVTPMTPTTPSPTAARKDNVWRSVFHPGSNIATKRIGAEMFDKPHPNSPTVYDWLYSAETRSKHR